MGQENLMQVAILLVYTEACIAVICLLGLLLGNPGVVKRNDITCFPLPDEVAERLNQGLPFERLGNMPGKNGSYCVRCMVWRPHDAHHCSTCQRCFKLFDHHCGVFGRCIGGHGLQGNMKYFKTLISMGVSGAITALAAIVCSTTRLFPAAS